MSIMKLFIAVILKVFLVYKLFLLHKVLARLNIVTVTSGRTPGSGVEPIRPGFEIALRDMSEKYPSLYKDYQHFRLDLIGAVNATLTDQQYVLTRYLADAIYNASKESGRDGQTVLFTSVGTWGYPLIGDLARELNFLSLSCGSIELSRSRFPTSLYLFPGSVNLFGEALASLMKRFSWKSIVVINDKLSKITVSARTITQCRGCLTVLQRYAADIYQFVIDIDSSVREDDVEMALLEAKNHSRIILVCTLHLPMRQLMAKAIKLNMTFGDYVFLFLYEMEIPFEPPLRWKHHDPLDQDVKSAFRSVLVLRTAPIDWNVTESISERAVIEREKMFGTTYDPAQKWNEFMLNCYEGVDLVSSGLETLHSSSTDPVNRSQSTQLLSGRQLADYFFRQKSLLTFRNVSFLPNGDRRPDIILQNFDYTNGTFKMVMTFEPFTLLWTVASNERSLWNGKTQPLDRPVCGIRGFLCPVSESPIVRNIAAGVIVTTILLLILGGYSFWYHTQSDTRQVPNWWIVSDVNL